MADQQLYQDQSNVPFCKSIFYRFTVDAGNAPALAASPSNIYITSVSRVSQGLYRLTLSAPYKNVVGNRPTLSVTGAGVARWAQPGTIANVGTSSNVTVDILIVDNAGAVQNPPAAATDNFVWGEIVFADIAAV